MSSISRIVASGVDFFAGITAAEGGFVLGVALGLLLLAAGDEALLGEGAVSDLGAGEVLSVVTETLGSEAVASGVAAGDGLSSWARANGMAAAKRAVMATSVIFMVLLVVELVQARPDRFEARIVVSAAILRQG